MKRWRGCSWAKGELKTVPVGAWLESHFRKVTQEHSSCRAGEGLMGRGWSQQFSSCYNSPRADVRWKDRVELCFYFRIPKLDTLQVQNLLSFSTHHRTGSWNAPSTDATQRTLLGHGAADSSILLNTFSTAPHPTHPTLHTVSEERILILLAHLSRVGRWLCSLSSLSFPATKVMTWGLPTGSFFSPQFTHDLEFFHCLGL